MPDYPKHRATVEWAMKELGMAESPPGSNTGPRVRYYQSHTTLPGTKWPWCAAFVVTCIIEGGKFNLPWRLASAHGLADAAAKAGWSVALAKMIPGDWIDWNIGTGHTSIFLEYHRASGMIKTIDGNSNDRVQIVERHASNARMAIHWPEKSVLPPAPPPKYEVVTSEGGTRKVVYVSGPKAIAGKLSDLLYKFRTITIRRKS